MMRPMKFGGEELLYGTDVLPHLAAVDGERFMIVIGGGSIERSGYLGRVRTILEDAGKKTALIRGVESDPGFKTVLSGAAEMAGFEPDWILAIGGGSVMDAAKAMWVVYEHPELDTLEKFSARHNNMPELRLKARMAAIPTTSGTASEVSRSVVISDDDSHVKMGASDMQMIPDLVLLDPEATRTAPAHITAETGMDALTHAVEAYVSGRANIFSDTFAEKAFRLIMENMAAAHADGDDMDARTGMLLGSALAGMAFTNVSLGIVHSMAHTIGSFFGIAHGLADAVLLPYIVEFNSAAAEAEAKYGALAALAGGEGSLSGQIRALNDRLGIPAGFRDLVGDKAEWEQNLDAMAAMAEADGCSKTNPVIPDTEGYKALFRLVWGD